LEGVSEALRRALKDLREGVSIYTEISDINE
jgi:hypothetical protein